MFLNLFFLKYCFIDIDLVSLRREKKANNDEKLHDDTSKDHIQHGSTPSMPLPMGTEARRFFSRVHL